MFPSHIVRRMSVLTKATINPRIVEAEYAVRGAIVLRSGEYQKQLASGDKSLPFDKIIPCNIGNPQILGQKPIQFHREVLALVNVPGLVDHPSAKKIFKEDAIARAKHYLAKIPGGTG
ncbi:alanine aminotransferase 2 [Thraustotheca clavata]|uniref:Alanine aminotransferase 2 n=1 Tax=Thraustotheca clavata TaxID=74557 RepID=A0A1W0ACJ9_9STRA|nr:alanine aminotransferase 2 [Thraustotheca clavata]